MTSETVTTDRTYSRLQKAFHWVTAILVFGALPVGIALDQLPRGDIQNTAYHLHRSVGILILMITAVRLANRVVFGAPPHEPSLPAWQVRASTAAHWALYALLFIVPLLGWAGTSAFGAPISFFGLFRVPDLVEQNRALSETLLDAHGAAAMLMAAIFVIHIIAALYHRFIRHDDVMGRML